MTDDLFDDKDMPHMSIAHIAMPGQPGERDVKIPDPGHVEVLPTRNLILFPGVTTPVSLSREASKQLVEAASKQKYAIGVICQTDPEVDDPSIKDLYKYGVLAEVINVIKFPDNTTTAFVRAMSKFRITGEAEDAMQGHLAVAVRPIRDVMPRQGDSEFEALVNAIRDSALKIVDRGHGFTPDVAINLRNIDDAETIINTVATVFPFDQEFKIKLLTLHRVKERAFEIITELCRQEQMLELTDLIKSKARQGLEENQRRVFLNEQMEAIRTELYGNDGDEADELAKRAESTSFPEDVRKTFDKELEKLRRLNTSSPDYAIQYNYLDTLLELPWDKETELSTDFIKAQETLDADHYGLEKVKERILEQLAVMMHRPEGRSPILCFVGAPGVGKTSLGKSVAAALGRNYKRVSLGGVHDEAEIRGHRRTYIGAMPGRIIDAMKRAGSSNPVLLLDEIDKLGKDFKGDPAAALLEVLDPEQNNKFHDNFVDVDFDLSKVLFIATANTLSTLTQPLLDRMEIIDISGYVLEEKVEIARRHLIPKVKKELGIDDENFEISEDAIKCIIENYTSESGVRQLEKTIAKVLRKQLYLKMSGNNAPATVVPEDLGRLLGAAHFSRDRYEGNDFAGVVTGLAWTAAGGEILFIESSLAAGKGEKLTLTGNLGDVMKESATLALQYVRSHAAELGIDPTDFEKNNVHIHVPEGAIPKDGPSAGITMTTSIVSVFKGVKVKERLAMTGEMTLRGKVLPVGGIKEKILAAKRAGIKEIILCKENRKDVDEIPPIYLDGLDFHYVENINDVLAIALTDQKGK